MKVHKGPLNLSSVTQVSPLELMKEILLALEEYSIQYKMVNKDLI